MSRLFLHTLSGAESIALSKTFLNARHKEDGTFNVTNWLICLGIAVLLCLIITVWYNWPRKKCTASFLPGEGNTKINIIIQKGSVLKQKGTKVIHVLDTFETSIDKCEKRSLLHAFLSLNDVDIKELDKSITDSLSNNGYTPRSAPSPLFQQLKAANMKTMKYDIGAVAKYKKDYLLVAFSNMIDNMGHPDEKDLKQYIDSVSKVFNGLQKNHKENVVNQTYNLGVWGFQYNRRLYDTRMRIEIMVRAFIKISQKKPFCETLRICLYGKHADKVVFNEMQVLLDYIINTKDLYNLYNL